MAAPRHEAWAPLVHLHSLLLLLASPACRALLMLSCAETLWVDVHHHVVWLQEKPLGKEKGSQGRGDMPSVTVRELTSSASKGVGAQLCVKIVLRGKMH